MSALPPPVLNPRSAALARCFSMKVGILPESILPKMLVDRLVLRGTVLQVGGHLAREPQPGALCSAERGRPAAQAVMRGHPGACAARCNTCACHRLWLPPTAQARHGCGRNCPARVIMDAPFRGHLAACLRSTLPCTSTPGFALATMTALPCRACSCLQFVTEFFKDFLATDSVEVSSACTPGHACMR